MNTKGLEGGRGGGEGSFRTGGVRGGSSLYHWRYHYIIGVIITSLDIIGGIITSLEVSLHHWRYHYIIGGIITSLEASLHHWRYHYIIGGIITSLEVSLHHHIQATAIPISSGVTMVCVLLQHWSAMKSTIAMTTVMRMAVQLCVSCKGMVWAHVIARPSRDKGCGIRPS